MRFRNSVRLLMENFKNVYKIFLYKIIISVVAIALSCALLLPNLLEILESAEATLLVSDVKEFLRAVVSANGEVLSEFPQRLKDSATALLQLVDSKMTKIIWSLVGCGVVYLFERFADTLCYFSIGDILNDKMTSYAETPFSAAYIRNLGKASVYSVVYVPIVFLFDMCTMLLCYFLFFYLLPNILMSLFASVTLIAICQSAKLTITSAWLPALTADKKSLRQAMRGGDKEERRQWPKVFSTYLVSVYLVIIINVVGALCTFGSALLLTVPASYFFFICEQFVHYYTMKGKKYFITYDRIATNRDHGDSERFFATVEESDEKPGDEAEESDGTQSGGDADPGENGAEAESVAEPTAGAKRE